MPDLILGRCRCLDGCERDVYRDTQGRQYVVADNGERVVGNWLPPEPDDVPDLEADVPLVALRVRSP